jgi:hypothetical protein
VIAFVTIAALVAIMLLHPYRPRVRTLHDGGDGAHDPSRYYSLSRSSLSFR